MAELLYWITHLTHDVMRILHVTRRISIIHGDKHDNHFKRTKLHSAKIPRTEFPKCFHHMTLIERECTKTEIVCHLKSYRLSSTEYGVVPLVA